MTSCAVAVLEGISIFRSAWRQTPTSSKQHEVQALKDLWTKAAAAPPTSGQVVQAERVDMHVEDTLPASESELAEARGMDVDEGLWP